MCEWGRALRGRGAAEDGDLARPDNPSRCTLPITELREMPPSSAAIWLADNPSLHSFFRSSTRSSVQFMVHHPWHQSNRPTESILALRPTQGRRRERVAPETLENCPPHEISYQRPTTLLYAVTRAQ